MKDDRRITMEPLDNNTILESFESIDNMISLVPPYSNTVWISATDCKLSLYDPYKPQWKCPIHGAHFETVVTTSDPKFGTVSTSGPQVFCLRCIALLFSSAKVGVMEKV